MGSEELIDLVEVDGFTPVDLYQRREKIFTRFVGGYYQRLRFFTGWPLLLGYLILPWLTWNGKQAVLFDLAARQFHVFSTTFWPEDLWLLGWLLIIAAFGLFTLTTVVGRLWCGYTCPQTVWTSIFMWIEQVAEGSRNQRINLDEASMSFAKARKRVLKHAMWLTVAALTGLTFVGYFTSIRDLSSDLAGLDASGWALFWVIFFTVATYINAGWLREQVCIYMCPYARFQAAMIEDKTLLVSYDVARGEPRGLQKRSTALKATRELGELPGQLGDCVDCSLCVQVCPTGIDIRDGLQYQCIGCAHCIDACNQVMAKIGKDPGLIRYTSEHALRGGTGGWLSARSVGYGAVTLLMLGMFVGALWQRDLLSVEITRDRGNMYNVSTNGDVSNSYSFKLMNKTNLQARISVALTDSEGLSLLGDSELVLAPRESQYHTIQLVESNESLHAPVSSQSITFRICMQVAGQRAADCFVEESRFFRPSVMQDSSL